jgi:hypothetical protein
MGFCVALFAAAAVLWEAGLFRRTNGAQALEGGSAIGPFSARIGIVRHTSARIASAGVREASPAAEVVFGGSSAPAAFDLTGFGRVTLRSDGGLAVLSPATQRVLMFRPDGTPDRILGGLGAAPSEFRRAVDITLLAGDSLMILDQGNRKVAWFDSLGRFVKSRALPDSFPSSLGRIGGALTGGRVLVYSLPLLMQPAGDSTERLPVTIAAFAPESGFEPILVVPGIAVRAVTTKYGGRRALRPMPIRFGPQTQVTVWNGKIAVSTGEQGIVEVYDTTGRRLQRIQLELPRAPVTKAMRDSAVTADLARVTGPGVERLVDPRETERVIRQAPTADSLPVVSGLLAAPGGMLWVVATASAPPRTGWQAFGLRPDGTLAGRVTGSAPGVPVAFGSGSVIVAESDSDGVASLRRYRLESGAR